jgi:hypothetical protein
MAVMRIARFSGGGSVFPLLEAWWVQGIVSTIKCRNSASRGGREVRPFLFLHSKILLDNCFKAYAARGEVEIDLAEATRGW